MRFCCCFVLAGTLAWCQSAPLRLTLDQMRAALSAGPVTVETLPAVVVQDWIGTEGLAGPKFRAKRSALGDKPYYAPLDIQKTP